MGLSKEQLAILAELRTSQRGGMLGWNVLTVAVLATWGAMVHFVPRLANPLDLLQPGAVASIPSETLEQFSTFVPILVTLVFVLTLVLILSGRQAAKNEKRLLQIIDQLEMDSASEAESSGDSWRLE